LKALLLIGLCASSMVFAQNRIVKEIEDLGYQIVDNSRGTNLPRRDLMRVKSMLQRANDILLQGNPAPNPNPGPRPGPRPGQGRIQFVGQCTIDDDSDVDNTFVGNIYGTSQMDVLDICQEIAEKVFRHKAHSKVVNIVPMNAPVRALSATCAVDDDMDVDNTAVGIIARTTTELIDSCDVLAKNMFKNKAYSVIKSIEIAQPYSRVEANCTIDDDQDVDNSQVGKVYGSSVIEVAGICQEFAERRFPSRAYSKLTNIISL